jgi:hypothetical protein
MNKTILLLLLCMFSAAAQTTPEDYAKARLLGVVPPAVQAALTDPSAIVDDVVARRMAVRLGTRQFESAFTRRRTDVQLGANATGSGTTSLVSKAGLPDLFSAAAESGAFSRESEGTVTTLRVSAIGLKRLFSAEDCSTGSLCYDGFAAKGLEVHVAFDRGSGVTAVPLNTSNAPGLGALRPTGRISSAGLKWDFLSRATVLTKTLEVAAEKLTDPGKALALAVSATTNTETAQLVGQRFRAFLLPLLEKEFADAPKNFKSLAASDQTAAEDEYIRRTKRAVATAIDQAMAGVNIEVIETNFQARLKTQDEFIAAREKELNDVLYKSHGALELNHLNPASSPNMLAARFSYTNALGAVQPGRSDVSGPLTTVSVNVAASVFEKIPTNVKVGRFRDVQAALQLDRKLGKPEWELRPTFSLAGYYQYMAQNSVIEFKQDTLVPNTNIPLPRPAVEVLNTKGSIVIGQAKLVIPLSKGIGIPLSISGSNRTELLKNTINLNAQVGITFDLSGLLH